ncbi:restriction endonuclease subunit S [Bacteroides fragilis]|uniref:Type IC restriction-modification system specificity subunit, partial n=1 Tax=Bacteroides fragilis (strain ATCC 25285 / DSM 2151 / CCUG 4856 / JCM 11019 / LMG 10263 / NCTC 9343 / Onslow / VPI 2553 / EN-2) TaxID=272559 RepID=Q5LEB1_BACFN|nr:restriction endonuclease subunit S [Bacteroides fragilis]EXZ92248.1 type I restriction modification DNA specificity domain protein [Bacteroides fragilis str. Korea 419]EXZ94979.1 type I restriction modification DNA specificity domain protein [Bacteroides fragilis str. Korea 419]QCT78359.1 restriction endonuclease subunit S [Bacteroides fragilis]CAH07541.1 putative type IC restriction-modification system specificity subunit [Bacteroides fragilis NCTC 9343]
MRFPEFSGEWKKYFIRDIAEVTKGAGISKEQRSLFGTPCILYGELYTTYKSEVINDVQSKTDIDAKNLVRSKENDVIIPSSGETAIDISTARCVPYDDVLLGGDLNIIRLYQNDGRFLSYQLNGVRKLDIARVAQGSSVIHLYGESIKSLSVSLPALKEQQKIVSLLSLIDERIATQNKIIEEYKKLKNALAELFFAKSIEYTSIGEMCDVVMGQSPSSVAYNYTKNGLPLIQGNLDIFEGVTSPRMWTSDITKQCDIGDIILTVRAPVGDVAKSNMIACVGRGVCAIKVKESGCSEYVYQYLLYFKAKWGSIEQGSTFSAISRNDILNINIPVITKRLIVASHLLALFDSEISIEALNLNVYTKQKQYLLTKMFI